MANTWKERAACRDLSTEAFFPIGTRGPAKQQIAEAKTVCGKCPVKQECLDWALDTAQDHGIWGGHTPSERRGIKQKRRTPTKT